MSFLTNPSISGIQLPFNQLAGPLASLFNNEGAGNYVYPADLTSNPALSHAIQFSFYDWDTPFQQAYAQIPSATLSAAQQAINAYQGALTNLTNARNAYQTEGASAAAQAALTVNEQQLEQNLSASGQALFSLFNSAFSATTYKPRQQSKPLGKISLYLPDNLNASWDSNYNTVSMTQELGKLGFLASAADTIKGAVGGGLQNLNLANLMNDPSAKEAAAALVGKLGEKVGAQNGKAIVEQALGQFVNPQMQLIYQGRDFRNFSMSFIFTPKTSAEAQTVKNIIDSFIFYSSPGIVNANSNVPGRYLTPPQLVSVKMVFTGTNGITGAVMNQLQSSLNNVGLGFLNTSQSITDTITSGTPAKIFNIKECVITNVAVDYAPNGWAAFSDGYPVQTTMTVNLMETSMFTKSDVQNSTLQKVYSSQLQQAAQDVINADLNTASGVGAPFDYTGP